MRIDPIIRNLGKETAPGLKTPKSPEGGEPASFADQLQSKIGEVNRLQQQADGAVAESTVKGAANIHETMIRLEEAELGLRLVTRIRNKAVEAYQEVMRMQF